MIAVEIFFAVALAAFAVGSLAGHAVGYGRRGRDVAKEK